jgi:2-polyprenyl-6-hydroxyphenyl methylase/3-demethylubiquinone-9 3-methyltransferase
MSQHREEVASGQRFEFGANWKLFLDDLDETRIGYATQSLRKMLGVETLAGKSFLDIGSGSGVFSLAARGLGARVVSFDYDPESVACTTHLRATYFRDDPNWQVFAASILDGARVGELGTFDFVYSWGVLHHTGAMWTALGNAASAVAPGGRLFIALYNDQGRASGAWLRVKRAYNGLPKGLRWLVLGPAFLRLWGPTTLRDLFAGRPFQTWRNYGKGDARGMTAWRDVVDWVGGLPFEVAKPEQVFDFLQERGFRLDRLVTCAGGHGCNEYVFTHDASESRLA